MKKPTVDQRIGIGLVLLLLAFLCVVTGANFIWGAAGAFIAAGVTLACFAVGFFASCVD